MRIGLDVMGGDFAPQATLDGALMALDLLPEDDIIVLFGDKEQIELGLENRDFKLSNLNSQIEIIASENDILMSEHPLKSFNTKKKSSISLGFQYLKTGQIDSFASSGNSGAILVGSIYSTNVIPGIIRPASSAIVPKESGGISILLDIGTNPDPKPDVMYQFAVLGSIYAETVHGIKNPKVGLLNIGEEEGKGNMLTQAAYENMKGTNDFNFIGNVEGRDLWNDKADVIVCDGFTGNVVLKQVESMYYFMKKRGLTDDYIERFNYENYGGTPILGINAPIVLGHGISSAKAICNMILSSKDIYESNLCGKIRAALKN